MIQEGIYAILAGDSGVSAIVSSRIYPMVIPQTVYDEATKNPCIVYSMDARDRQVRFSGTATFVRGSFTVDSYAKTYAGSQALAAAVRGALIDYSGAALGNGSPQSSNVVKKIFIDSERDLMEAETGLYRVMQQYTIWYDE